MVYISSDGVVGGGRPQWKFSSIIAFFLGILNMVFLFLKTMMQPDLSSRGTGYESNYRNGFGGQPPPGPPRRRFHGFGNSQDSNPPPTGSCGPGGCCR